MEKRKLYAIGYDVLRNGLGDLVNFDGVEEMAKLMLDMVDNSAKTLDLPQSKRNQMAYDALCKMYSRTGMMFITPSEGINQAAEEFAFSCKDVSEKDIKDFFIQLMADIVKEA